MFPILVYFITDKILLGLHKRIIETNNQPIEIVTAPCLSKANSSAQCEVTDVYQTFKYSMQNFADFEEEVSPFSRHVMTLERPSYKINHRF